MPGRILRGLLLAAALGVLYGLADANAGHGLVAFTCCLIGAAAMTDPTDPLN